MSKEAAECKPKVVVTRKIPKQILALLEEECNVQMWAEEEQPIPRNQLLEMAADAVGIFSLLTDRIDQEMLEKAPKLKVVSNMAVGYDNIDLKACTAAGVMVTNTPGVLTETTADLTMALLLSTARRVVEASEYLRKGLWNSWSPMQLTGQDVFGATLGIIGLGRIGTAVAKRAKGFDMRILYYNRTPKQELEQELKLEYASLEKLLKESDFVVVLTPLTEETRNLIGKRELGMMKPTATLINCSRGSVVNEEDLYQALKSGDIWAAGLDVYEQEPISLDHPLLQLSNVVLLPHIGSASIATRTKMGMMAAENMLAALRGEIPPNLLNPQNA